MRGRIEKALSGFYYVNVGQQVLQCRARGKFRREGTSPLVGDWVQVRELGGGEGFVEEIEPRTNCFARPSAANIDQLVIIASAAIPVTDPYLIDRIAAIAALKGCGVLVCLNKQTWIRQTSCSPSIANRQSLRCESVQRRGREWMRCESRFAASSACSREIPVWESPAF